MTFIVSSEPANGTKVKVADSAFDILNMKFEAAGYEVNWLLFIFYDSKMK